MYFFYDFPAAGNNLKKIIIIIILIEKKNCAENLEGLLPKSYCERLNCIARKESVLQKSAVWLGKKLYCKTRLYCNMRWLAREEIVLQYRRLAGQVVNCITIHLLYRN